MVMLSSLPKPFAVSSLVWMVANILLIMLAVVASRRTIVREVEKTLKPKRYFRIVTFEIIILYTHNNQQHKLINLPPPWERWGEQVNVEGG